MPLQTLPAPLALGRRYLCRVCFIGLIMFASDPRCLADNVQATYINSNFSGLYNVASNWSNGVVPNNDGLIHYNVTLAPFTSIQLDTDATIDNLDASRYTDLQISDCSFKVNGNSTLNQIEVSAQTANTVVTLGNLAQFSAASKTLAPLSNFDHLNYYISASGAQTATLSFNGADIVTNAAKITLQGANARVMDENGNDALRNIATNLGILTLTSHSVTTKGDFTNSGDLFLYGDSSAFIINGDLLNFEKATHTLHTGSYTLYGNSSTTPMLRFNDANIVTNAASIVLQSANSRIVDQFGNDALRNFARNDGYFTLNGADFNTSSDFTNNGTLSIDGKFKVSGTLTNLAGHTLGGGTYNISKGGALQISDADITTNAATVTLDSGGTVIDQFNNNAFRSLAHNTVTGIFGLIGTNLAVSGGFTNEGDLSLDGRFSFGDSPTIGALRVAGDFLNAGSTHIGVIYPTGFAHLLSQPSMIELSSTTAKFANTNYVGIGEKGSLSLSSSGIYVQTAGVTQLGQGTLNAAAVHIKGGKLTGTGTINGNLSVESGAGLTLSIPQMPALGQLAFNETHSTLTVNGSLALDPSVHTGITIGGKTPGIGTGGFDNLVVHGPVTLTGTLDLFFNVTYRSEAIEVIFPDGSVGISVVPVYTPEYIPSRTDTFTFLSADSIAGQFDNAPDGSRILTTDGFGSFMVHYASGTPSAANAPITQVVLSDFQSLPEPSSMVVLAGMSAIALNRGCRNRRRRACVRSR
jgi:hypothetical protein